MKKLFLETKNKLTKFCKSWYKNSKRRMHQVKLNINSRDIDFAVIDSHYELKHSSYMNDSIILLLLQDLNNLEFEPEEIDEDGFEYYSTEPHYYEGKTFKLIWLLPKKGTYIGIINCYRRSYGRQKNKIS